MESQAWRPCQRGSPPAPPLALLCCPIVAFLLAPCPLCLLGLLAGFSLRRLSAQGKDPQSARVAVRAEQGEGAVADGALVHGIEDSLQAALAMMASEGVSQLPSCALELSAVELLVLWGVLLYERRTPMHARQAPRARRQASLGCIAAQRLVLP